MNFELPQWFYEAELDSGAGAYDALDPRLRAYLKTQISLLHTLWLPASGQGGCFQSLPAQTTVFQAHKAQDWVLFFLSDNYASPAGFIAAVLPALMSGVETVLLVRAGKAKDNLHPAISAAMELLGREEIFSLPADKCVELVNCLYAQSTHGRIVGLGYNFPGGHSLPGNIRIGLDGVQPDLDVLSWLHPGALVEDVRAEARYDAVISATAENESFLNTRFDAPLLLGPEQAYFWQWPALEPLFFQRKLVFVK